METVNINTEQVSSASLEDYFQLLKPRVMSLSIFTALCGMLCAPGSINPAIGFAGIFAIALGAGGAGCLNMWLERKTDAMMDRTKNRPIPAGRIDADSALGFGLALSFFSVMILSVCVNYASAIYLAITIIFYTFIYTVLLKPNTPQNIVIGGASGALPPVIGWVCVMGETSLLPWLMFMIILLWTPPHFWALALKAKKDFAKANLPMMPNIRGDAYTKRLIVFYSIFLAAASYGLAEIPALSGLAFNTILTVLNTIFVLGSLHLWRAKDNGPTMKFFAYTIFYLFVIFFTITGFCYLTSAT